MKKYEFHFKINGKDPLVGGEKQVIEFTQYRNECRKIGKEIDTFDITSIEECWSINAKAISGFSLIKETAKRIEDRNNNKIVEKVENEWDEAYEKREIFIYNYFKKNSEETEVVLERSKKHKNYESSLNACRGRKDNEERVKKAFLRSAKIKYLEEINAFEEFYQNYSPIIIKRFKKQNEEK